MDPLGSGASIAPFRREANMALLCEEKETSDRGDESGRWQMAGGPRLGVIQRQTVTALPRKILDRYRLSLGEGAGTAHCMTACTRRVISSASS